jgi:hypothetical protein
VGGCGHWSGQTRNEFRCRSVVVMLVGTAHNLTPSQQPEPPFFAPLLPLRRLTHLFMRASVPSLSFFLSELCIKSKIKYHVGRINIVAYVCSSALCCVGREPRLVGTSRQ